MTGIKVPYVDLAAQHAPKRQTDMEKACRISVVLAPGLNKPLINRSISVMAAKAHYRNLPEPIASSLI